MTAIHWLTDINGSFTNAADWSGGKAPGPLDDAILDAGGDAFTVTSSVSETINSLVTAANATLVISAGAFDVTAGPGAVSNDGVIHIGDTGTLTAGGMIANAGVITIGDTSASRAALTIQGDTTLSGGGQITLAGKHSSLRGGQSEKNEILFNTDDTLSGVGAIGAHLFEIENSTLGVIDADGSGRLTVSAFVQNYGTIEAAGHVTLVVSGNVNNAADGIILARDNAFIVLSEDNINGGVLMATGAGAIAASHASLNGVTIRGAFGAGDGTYFSGNIKNYGVMTLFNDLEIDSAVKLMGSGSIDMEGGMIQGPPGASTELENVSDTIQGSGVIGYHLTLSNGAAGVIEQLGTGGLLIQSANQTIKNAGLITSSGSGGVLIASDIINSGVLGAGGGAMTIKGKVSGGGQVLIAGGTIEFESTFNQAAVFAGAGGVLELAHSRAYTKPVSGFSSTGGTGLDLDDIGFVSPGEASFSGKASGGVLTVTDGTHSASIRLEGDYLGVTFVASSDGHGGTDVVAGGGQTASVAHFAGVMAAMIGHEAAAGLVDGRTVSDGRQMMLTAPRRALA